MRRKTPLIVGICMLCAARLSAQVYLDPDQPIDRRIQDLISQMTLEEKALQLYHGSQGLERLKVPHWAGWNQCLHGVWSMEPTTCFPVSIAMGATWDPELVQSIASAISTEARALYHKRARNTRGLHGLVYRAPVINISRDPRWGRVQETYSEDPYLLSRMAVAYVKGLQGDDPKYLKVAATLKHFAVNNVETGRQGLSAQVPERMLHEYWLPHFRAAVVEGRAQSIMAAFNGINGVPCAVNKMLLTDILRGQWGFEGFVVSDTNGIRYLMTQHRITQRPEEAVAKAMLAGCDYDDEHYRDALPAAVREGLVSEDAVNQALSRLLRVAFKLGVFDPADRVPYTRIPATVIDSPEHRQLAYRAAVSSIVLLSNRQDFLPLDKAGLKSVAVIGPAAATPEYGDYFNYNTSLQRISPLQGLQNRLGTGVKVVHAEGCGFTDATDPAKLAQAAEAARQSDVAVVVLGTNLTIEKEARDRTHLNLPGAQQQLLEAVHAANPRTVLVLMNAGPLAVKWARDNVPAILQAWYAGEEAGHAIADVLLGQAQPGGRLPYTVYESLDQVPPASEYDVSKGFTYMYFKGQPVFPFGHGMSYTRFEYANLSVSMARLAATGSMMVRVDVKNTGIRPGDEVVQAYVRRLRSSVVQPIRKLVAFRKVRVEPGQTVTVEFPLGMEQLAYYDEGSKRFVEEPGALELQVGASSADIRATVPFEIERASSRP